MRKIIFQFKPMYYFTSVLHFFFSFYRFFLVGESA
jgi:hypothetical protein